MSNTAHQKAKTKGNLSKELIVQTSITMIEEIGVEKFSLRKLAEKLNCEPMSIYYHLKNKDQIFDEIVDFLILSIQFESEQLPIKQQLISIAQQWRTLAKTYSNFFPVLAVHQLNTHTGSQFMNQVLAIFQSAGLPIQQGSYFLRILNYYLIGAGIDEAKGYQLGSSATQPVKAEELVHQYPLLAQALPYWTTEYYDEIFNLGLEMLLVRILPS
ncbi:TetR/AcrR family transcriptional regulator C-terminal domain-containing protein [Acinetobacter sp. ANC 4805]|uniref:TetR/AcrR family transcriptional regulator C-terminal domain-containing protein n=1 Tax=Acinetobacter sp. ANC 4805 TaxID=2923425 RepID=UPI001F4B2EF3|nr:TetR/AcrR family transcriptional regulator C-terminal domain-containing protein [Acinetobacter sp. ANC 4805]MCH7310930.1 TetR/AcrR family transcriptional regulator C-terminal domain-containing protein [Acinetobacter sp. ANC 4805]